MHTPRTMTSRHTRTINKVKNVADNVLVAVFYGPNMYVWAMGGEESEINNGYRKEVGRIRDLSVYKLPNVVEIATRGYTTSRDQVDTLFLLMVVMLPSYSEGYFQKLLVVWPNETPATC